MKQMEAPRCRLCEKNHWAREGCFGMLLDKQQGMTKKAPITAAASTKPKAKKKTTRKGGNK
jgi:hypothetical protein